LVNNSLLEDDQRCQRKKYLVDLSDENASRCISFYTAANILLANSLALAFCCKPTTAAPMPRLLTPSWSDGSPSNATRQRFVESGLAALNDKPRPGKKPKLSAKAEARLIAEACSQASQRAQPLDDATAR